MAVQKNFVVKHGLEVNNDLIFADNYDNRVGIGTTNTEEKLHVAGGVRATNFVVSGVGSASVLRSTEAYVTDAYIVSGIVTTISGTTASYTTGNFATANISAGIFTSFNATDITGVAGTITNFTSTNSTITNISGTAGTITNITGTTGNIVNLTSTNQNITGISTIATLSATQTSTQFLDVTGIGTLNNMNCGIASISVGELVNLYVDNIGFVSTFSANNGIITSVYATTAYINTGIVTSLSVSGISTVSGIKVTSGIVTANSGVATFYGEFYGPLTGTASTASFATTAYNLTDAANITTGTINYTRLSGSYNIDITGNSSYAIVAGVATYAGSAGIATYATTAGIATYATVAGVSTYAESSGIATYATSSGISSTLISTANVNTSGIITATGGFISVGNTTPIQITLSGTNLIFTAVGIGSTTLKLS